ncbi:MAG: hypothetical protein GTN78_14925, partial [Gemmatimonadales bacterium]|nr:hypothetical protein [Gemmatimonadales bacterium]
MSVISDYFSDDLIQRSPDQPALGGPLWHDLYVLGRIGEFAWRLVGD